MYFGVPWLLDFEGFFMSIIGYFCDFMGLYTLVNVFFVVVILYVSPLLIHLLLSTTRKLLNVFSRHFGVY